MQANFLEKSALCARSFNCEGFKGHGHNHVVDELLNCGRLQSKATLILALSWCEIKSQRPDLFH